MRNRPGESRPTRSSRFRFDPLTGPEALDRHVRGIRAAARSELARRQAARGVRGIIVHWRWPILATSALMAVISVAALLEARATSERPDNASAAARGIPSAWDGGPAGETAPAPADSPAPEESDR